MFNVDEYNKTSKKTKRSSIVDRWSLVVHAIMVLRAGYWVTLYGVIGEYDQLQSPAAPKINLIRNKVTGEWFF